MNADFYNIIDISLHLKKPIQTNLFLNFFKQKVFISLKLSTEGLVSKRIQLLFWAPSLSESNLRPQRYVPVIGFLVGKTTIYALQSPLVYLITFC